MQSSMTLDDIPRPAWIVLMILGFILFWPIGLVILGYLMWSGKLRNGLGCSGGFRSWRSAGGFSGSTGNHAFDSYREETLRRLEEESREFRSFLERLRRAKDQEEFDRFMAERRADQPAKT